MVMHENESGIKEIRDMTFIRNHQNRFSDVEKRYTLTFYGLVFVHIFSHHNFSRV